MDIRGEQIIKKGSKIPTWIWIGYLICIIIIICATFSMKIRNKTEVPEAIDFTTDGALGIEENKYAYLEVQGLTEEVAIYGNTNNESDEKNDRYYIAFNNGYWYVVDLDFETIDKLKELKDYTYSTDENAVAPDAIKIYGMTENISDELKQMLIDYYNESVEEENKISLDDFERYFGSALLNVRRSPVDTTVEKVSIILATIGIVIIAIFNISMIIIKRRIKKYIVDNGYEKELADQLDDNVEEKHYKDQIILTKDFLVDLNSSGGFTAFKFSDVKWIHIHNVKYYGIVTTSSSIIVHLKDGKANIQCVKIKGGTTDEFLEIFNKICEKVPTDCLKGYTKENQEMFKKYRKELKERKIKSALFLS